MNGRERMQKYSDKIILTSQSAARVQCNAACCPTEKTGPDDGRPSAKTSPCRRLQSLITGAETVDRRRDRQSEMRCDRMRLHEDAIHASVSQLVACLIRGLLGVVGVRLNVRQQTSPSLVPLWRTNDSDFYNTVTGSGALKMQEWKMQER